MRSDGGDLRIPAPDKEPPDAARLRALRRHWSGHGLGRRLQDAEYRVKIAGHCLGAQRIKFRYLFEHALLLKIELQLPWLYGWSDPERLIQAAA